MKTKNQQFLEELNKAFAKNDTEYIIKNVTENIKWTVVSDFSVEGKEEFMKYLKEMEAEEPFKMKIENIITHGKKAAVNGVMTSAEGEQYAFCDVYKLSGFKDPKISEIVSYVIDLKTNQ